MVALFELEEVALVADPETAVRKASREDRVGNGQRPDAVVVRSQDAGEDRECYDGDQVSDDDGNHVDFCVGELALLAGHCPYGRATTHETGPFTREHLRQIMAALPTCPQQYCLL